ncbi:MAG: pilus assembly protein [Holosporaceae bacterium]|jgi:hypothetical protein|nr:pilus assembly protein [Holosporaceae bacterium]
MRNKLIRIIKNPFTTGIFNNFRRVRAKILWLIRPVSGVAALEASLTLPIMCMLIFSSIEILKMHLAQTAINVMCTEMTFKFIATRSWGSFEEIMDRHRPKFIPKNGADGHDVVRFSMDSWASLADMMAAHAYGGSSIHYPGKGECSMFEGGSQNYNSPSCCIPVNGADIHCGADWRTTARYLTDNTFPSGRVFVLDVTVAYPFSNSFVKKLFNGGSNSRWCGVGGTNVNSTPGKDTGKYILWARGVGITN